MTKRKKGTAARRSRIDARASAKAFALSSNCTINEGPALKSALLEILQEPMPVALDIARVQRIDTAGMQLLAAFVRERELLGLQTEWRGVAPTFTSAARLLGVTSVLKLPGQA